MRIVLACLVVASLGAAFPATAVDLTGTWSGTFKCDQFDGERAKFPPDAATLRISQNGDALNVDWVNQGHFNGIAISDAKKPLAKGEAKFAECETDADMLNGYDEVARLRVKVNRDKGTGKLSGESIYMPDGGLAGTCKWKFKLTNPTDPMVGGCP